jgi:glycosyltransferase involved in cell wall biosynthesis
MQRIAFLLANMSGYWNACIYELSQRYDVQLLVSSKAEDPEAPFDAKQFDWIAIHYVYPVEPEKEKLEKLLENFSPEVLCVSGWHIGAYRQILKRVKRGTTRILFMDNQWRGTLKQRSGTLISNWYVRPLFETAYVPGDRQKNFALRLGFDESEIFTGALSCDHSLFSRVYNNSVSHDLIVPDAFIYIGRFVTVKGISTLAQAYTRYREIAKKPAPLICCGVGNLKHILEGVEGVEIVGFKQPAELATLMSKAGCLVLPSFFEPWGVVIHEAAAAGLAIICTSSCGASDHLVENGVNGYIIEPGDVESLALTMIQYSSLSQTQRRNMSTQSHTLSLRYTPTLWADQLIKIIKHFPAG